MSQVAVGFDLDGTVTRQEILPRIAQEIDLYDEISVLTAATIQGVIPFEKSFRLRCRLLKEVPVSVVRSIVAQIPLDENVAAFIQKHPKNCFIISGNLDAWVQPLIERLHCSFFVSEGIVEEDTLMGIRTVLNKANAVKALKSKFEKVVVIGEGMNDVPMFETADIRIAYGGVHQPNSTVVQLSDYVTMNGAALCRLLNTLL